MRDMDRWLGDGGMPLITELGGRITTYGDGWAEAEWVPTARACNPGGTVQTGVEAVLLDAVMSFALSAALERGDRSATLEMKVSSLQAARAGVRLTARGEVLRLGGRVAFLHAWLRAGDELISEATGTFAIFRADGAT